MPGSLQQLGKSRADLWQFAGLVALERSLERANRACDLDYWGRQQVDSEDYKLVCMNISRSHCLREEKPVRSS